MLLVTAVQLGVHAAAKHGPTGGLTGNPGSTWKSGGGATGVTEFDEAELSELTPYGVSSLTVNVYAVPFDKPVTVIDVHGEVHVPVIEPGLDVAR